MPRRSASARHDEWYADGLRFECTGCGKCCTGPPGAVHFTPAEAEGMARAKGMTVERFTAECTHETFAGPSLREVETEHGFDCIFLDRASVPGKAVCSIYDARPRQCRTFPFWPELIESPRSWQQVGRRCEGVDRGKVVPIEQIRVLRDG